MDCEFSELKGKTFIKVERIYDDEIRFYLSENVYYRMYHKQNCCEDVNVTIDDICGDLNGLVDAYIHLAEEVTHVNENPEGVEIGDKYQDSFTWTFYKISTHKGSVTIRWYGASNGYYSESVNLILVIEELSK